MTQTCMSLSNCFDKTSYCFLEQPESICKGKADVGFIVDSSGSLANEYSKEKEFVNQMIHKLQLSPSGTHSALVLFSYSADLKIKFSDYQNVKDFQRAVQALPLMKSTTRIDKALKLAYNDMFNAANGMRPNVPKILVLLTDGEQTHDHDAILPSEAVKPFHKAGIKVIVIGIGSGVKQDELLTIVKSPEDLYFAETFDELKSDSFVKNITDATCKATGK